MNVPHYKTEFTGISAPYEEPEDPEITIDTDRETIDEDVNKIISYLEKNGLIKRQSKYIPPLVHQPCNMAG